MQHDSRKLLGIERVGQVHAELRPVPAHRGGRSSDAQIQVEAAHCQVHLPWFGYRIASGILLQLVYYVWEERKVFRLRLARASSLYRIKALQQLCCQETFFSYTKEEIGKGSLTVDTEVLFFKALFL